MPQSILSYTRQAFNNNQKLWDISRKKKRETKQSAEPDSDMKQILKLSDKELKITMINILKILMEKVDNMQDQMVNFSREMEYMRNN